MIFPGQITFVRIMSQTTRFSENSDNIKCVFCFLYNFVRDIS